jgi:hypothetical protein
VKVEERSPDRDRAESEDCLMKTKLLAVATIASVLTAGAAFAALPNGVTSITVLDGLQTVTGASLITDFNSFGGTDISGVGSQQGGTINDLAAGFTFTQNSAAYTRNGSAGLDPGVTAPPPADSAAGDYYETVLGGGSATLTSIKGLKEFSFYLGSPDSYNSVVFKFVTLGGSSTTLNGSDIWGNGINYGGNQSVGKTVVYTFGPAPVKSITFSSTGNSFEFDKLAGTAVPEPASWALMIMGFGAAGAMLRGKRRQGVTA